MKIANIVSDEYLVDCPNFRTEDKAGLLRQLYDMTERRFALLENWIERKPWDFFMFVEIGSDRLHHGFWKFFDPKHRGYVPGNKFENTIRQYHEDLDFMLSRLLQRIDLDATHVYVLSDHGAKRMDGGVCLNEWLVREGYLRLRATPDRPTPFSKLEIDWSHTAAWGEGGYYGRVFFNIAGREPKGTVLPGEVETLARELERKLCAIGDEHGRPMETKVFRPAAIYRAIRGIPPDLLVYFDDLRWRSVGSVGYGAIHTFENDTGPDDANHAEDGLYIESRSDGVGDGRVDGEHLLHIRARLLGSAGVATAA